jgi:hypothetical protein
MQSVRRGGRALVLLEQLESRELLSTVTWTGAGNGTLWSDARNWDTQAVPVNGDDVVLSGNSTDDLTTGGNGSSALTLHNLTFSSAGTLSV